MRSKWLNVVASAAWLLIVASCLTFVAVEEYALSQLKDYAQLEEGDSYLTLAQQRIESVAQATLLMSWYVGVAAFLAIKWRRNRN